MSNPNIKFAHTAHISPKGKPRGNTSQMWSMLMAGLVCGFVGMYFTVTRPMTSQMQFLESELTMMQSEMDQLVGTRDDLWKTNDLLTGLRQQQRQLSEAQAALTAMREMKNEVIALMDQQTLAVSALKEVYQLQNDLIANRTELEKSQQAMLQIASLQNNLNELGTNAEARQVSLNQANVTLAQVEDLTNRTRNQIPALNEAQQVITSVDKLSGHLLARTEAIRQSQDVVQQWEVVQDRINGQSEKLPTAVATLDQMSALESRLSNYDASVTKQAEQNLTLLTELGTELSTGSERITSAVKTIELLEDFQTEMERQATTLTGMRKDLMEITFLESTVRQTLQVLKPLIQLTDMRRMSDSEVREAARVIMDRRIADSRGDNDLPTASRMTEQEITSPKITNNHTDKGDVRKVPDPTDLE